jgi:hypothetical protein
LRHHIEATTEDCVSNGKVGDAFADLIHDP